MSSQKRKVFEELNDEIRRSQVATDRYDQAVAEAVGANRTDMRCLDILDREGAITAGRLAEAAGLTSGATTTAIDRLERAGFARRLRDGGDRRRVLVELVPDALSGSYRYYAAHAELGERMFRRYDEAQLRLLRDFVREGRELNEREAAKLERENHKAKPGSAPRRP